MAPIDATQGKQKIIPHLWYDKEAKQAAEFYVSTFGGASKVTHVSELHDTPSGDTDIVSFELAGLQFMAISAGQYFKFTPAISIAVQCETEEEIDRLYAALIKGGSALMALDHYDFSKKFGWVRDRWGLTWQLNQPHEYDADRKIAPFFLFTQEKAGKAEEAMRFWTSVFPDSKMGDMFRHEGGGQEKEGSVQHATFTLCGQEFMAMDSALDHKFTFTEAVSLLVKCDSQEEIDRYWSALSAVPESEQCGWLKDKYGVSWQIAPRIMDEMMTSGDEAARARVTQAFLKMKKFDIAALQAAYEGHA